MTDTALAAAAQYTAGRPPSAGQLLTAQQLAERWQVPKSHIYRLTRDHAIPAVRLGRYYRFRLDAIERFELGEPA